METGSFVCEWTLDATGAPSTTPAYFEFPVFPRTIATVTVVLRGEDLGWRYAIHRTFNSTDRGDWETLGRSAHDPSATGNEVVSSTFSHYLVGPPEAGHVIQFVASSGSVYGARVGDANPVSASRGTFQISYVGVPLPDGEVPVRPAATREDPQIADPLRDAPSASLDIAAAWFDDARVADGLFDVHLALRDLANLTVDGTPTGQGFVVFVLSFAVNGESFGAHWWASEDADEGVAWSCQIRSGGAFGEPLSSLPCEVDVANATLAMTVPEALVGSPAPGVLFEDAAAGSYVGGVTGASVPHDRTRGVRYAFALGGPVVWDELNPRLAVVPPPPLPWYRAPFARENVPDTLQVLGVPTAGATFLFGAIVLRRRRVRVKEWFDRVDVVVAEHERDARRGLLALGEIEASADRAYRAGKLHENEYQLVSQRVATAATRLARRRELGLDDGAPDSSVPRPGGAR